MAQVGSSSLASRSRVLGVAPIEAEARNIAFDVTPNRLITGIVTENGVVYPPFEVNLKKAVLGE